ncbi:MAG: molybdopterin-dependent oxidoreductase [Actinobacteria bacterium]|nr:molybdopterin-dependent oxidoreductase [Actinomycetota bacterium]
MRSKQQGSIFGVLAVLMGLVAGDLSATFNSTWSSPIISLGNRIIDYVPQVVKKYVIKIFGLYDKVFLVALIIVCVLAISIFIGRAYASGREKMAYLTIAAMMAVSGLASLLDAQANLTSLAPTLVSGGTTIYVLRWLGAKKKESELAAGSLTRRDLLKAAAILGAVSISASALGKALNQKTTVARERIAIALPKPLKFLAKPPADPALKIAGLSPFFTPNKDFYRIDTALSIPNLSVDDWTLEIVGMVNNPLRFTYAQLIARPVFELDDTIACVSNEVGGPLVGNARWLGVRLDDLIREAQPTADADQIMGYSYDGFTAGFPLATLDGRDAMIAIGMNGEALPSAHGFPARIIVPGLYGYVSATKWLVRIELTRFDEKHGYWISRGWSERAPIKTQSRIDTPAAGSKIQAGTVAIAGVAWAPTRGILKVEVRVGMGPWRAANLGEVIANTTWRQWWIDWNAKAGDYIIAVRASDGDGNVQSEQYVAIEPNGAEGWHSIKVRVS